mgnify:CR=1 FL=1
MGGGHLRDDSALFDQWLADRHHSILTYRDQSAVSYVSGVPSLKGFGVPWLKMFTDDKASYLMWCKAQYEAIQNQKSKL